MAHRDSESFWRRGEPRGARRLLICGRAQRGVAAPPEAAPSCPGHRHHRANPSRVRRVVVESFHHDGSTRDFCIQPFERVRGPQAGWTCKKADTRKAVCLSFDASPPSADFNNNSESAKSRLYLYGKSHRKAVRSRASGCMEAVRRRGRTQPGSPPPSNAAISAGS